MTDDGPVLLVVDDSDDNRYTLVRRLRRQGHQHIREAENGRIALEVLNSQPIDLVMIDVFRPEVAVAQVLSTMKLDMDLRDVPVIMISAADELDIVVRCLELGAEDYLPKPFNPTVLNARVTASLDKRRLRNAEHAYLSQLEHLQLAQSI